MYPGILEKLGVADVPLSDDVFQKKKQTLYKAGNSMPYSLRIVFAFIYVPQSYEH